MSEEPAPQSLLEKNLAALAALKVPPALPKDFLENVRDPDWVNTQDDLPFEHFVSRQGHGVLRVVEEDKKTSLNNPQDPYREPTQALQKLDRDAADTVVLMGFGLGYAARTAIGIFGEHLHLCILEPSQNAFAIALRHQDLTDIFAHQHLYLAVAPAKGAAYRVSHEAYDPTASAHLHQVAEPYFTLPAFIPVTKMFTEAVQDTLLMAQVNFNTGNQVGLTIHHNMLSNLRFGVRAASAADLFAQDFRGRPAIVIAPGPSLRKNIHLLKDLEEKALLLALDTSIKPLAREAIKPHLVCTIDPNPINVGKFPEEGLPDDVGFYGCLDSCAAVWEQAPRMAFAYHRDFALSDQLTPLIGPKTASHSGGSVVTDAILLANTLGCDPIITVGFDLAFTNNEWYAPGSFRTDESQRHPDEIEVPAALGGTVRTAIVYYTTLLWIDAYLPRLMPDANLIDATEGGAKKAAFTLMPLAEAIEKYCQEPFGPREKVKKAYEAGVAWLKKNPPPAHPQELIDIMEKTHELAVDLVGTYEKLVEGIQHQDSREFLELAQQADAQFEEFQEILGKTNQLNTVLYAHLVRLAGVDTTGLGEGSREKHLAYLQSSHEFWISVEKMVADEIAFLRDAFMEPFLKAREDFFGPPPHD